MSSKNDNSGVAMVFGVVCTVLVFIAAFIFALAAFAALILSILCLIAWDDPLRLGKVVIEPYEARAFIYRGLAGAVMVPAFILFSALLFGFFDTMNTALFPYVIIGGYCLGAFWPMLAEEGIDETIIEAAPLQQIAPPAQQPASERSPFSYASWDDEDARH